MIIKKITLILVLVALSRGVDGPIGLSGQSNPAFTAHVIDNAYANCTAVSAADVNRDGKMDILSANWQGNGSIVWWQNLGNGQFSSSVKEVVSRSFAGATSLYADDLDHDGDLDIVAASIYNKLAWFENQGSGVWRKWDAGYLNASALAPVSVEKGGQSYILLASTSPWSGIFMDLPQTSTGHQPSQVSALSGEPSAVYPGDIDHDGDLDYVAASRYGSRVVWDELTPGVGQPRHVVDASFGRPTWVRTADLDRDGDMDILATSYTMGLFWWANDGNGASWTRYRITPEVLYDSALQVGDMDGDGDVDVVGSTANQMIWLENLGSPTQSANWIRRTVDINHSSNPRGYALFPADIDGDGQMDIVGCDRLAGTGQSMRLGWWENGHTLPAGGALSYNAWTIDDTLTGAWGVDVADLNGDGRLDVAAAGYGDGATQGQTRWWRNLGGTPLGWTRAYSATFDKGRGVTAVSTGPGRPYYQVSGNDLGEVREFRGSNWYWDNPIQWTKLSNLGDTYTSAVADLNRDGLPDVIGASADDNFVVWAQSSITSTSWAQLTIDNNCGGARAVASADLDGDGDADVAAACPNETRIYWWKNNANGSSWSKQSNLAGFPGATDVECGDIDRDGRPEIVAASPGASSIAWFNPDETGGEITDSMGWVTDVFTGVEHLRLADLDRDGDLDVIATSYQRDELVWFENQYTTQAECYSGCFVQRVLDEAMGGPRELAVGDLNGDGAPDLVVATQNNNTVRRYEQQIGVELSLEKWLDTTKSTGVISTGQSIPYIVQVTNNGPTNAGADAVIVDTWDPPYAVIAASGPGCVANTGQGVMTCTLPTLPAGAIREYEIVITPSLTYNGYITNTATILPVSPFWNTTPYWATDSAAPVLVQRDDSICDLLVRPGQLPTLPIFPGSYFSYTMGVLNLGPRSGVTATMVNQWSPAAAISNFTIVGVSGLLARSTATYDCVANAGTGEVSCNLDDLVVGVPVTVTIGITTSQHFSDVLESTVTLTGAYEGNPDNNQTLPIRVGARPFDKVYLPLVLR